MPLFNSQLSNFSKYFNLKRREEADKTQIIFYTLFTRVRDKNFMFFNQTKDIEYWTAFQGRLIYLYSLVLIPKDKLPV